MRLILIFTFACLVAFSNASSRAFDEDKPTQTFKQREQQEQQNAENLTCDLKRPKKTAEEEFEDSLPDPAEEIRKMIARSKLPKEFQSLDEIPPEDDGKPMYKHLQSEDPEFWRKENERIRLDEFGNQIPQENIIDARTDSTIEIYRKMLAGMKGRFTERTCEEEKREYIAKITQRAQELVDQDPNLKVLWTTPDVKNMKPEVVVTDEDIEKHKKQLAEQAEQEQKQTNMNNEENTERNGKMENNGDLKEKGFKKGPVGQYEDEDDFS